MKGMWMSSPASNTWPLWQLIHDCGCNRVYYMAMQEVKDEHGNVVGWEPNTRQINNPYRQACTGPHVLKDGQAYRFQYGIVRDAHWDGTTDPLDLARKAHADLNTATGNDKTVPAPYQFDIEFPYRDGDWLLACFKEFRRLRPTRLLSWTMEPMQGGWIKGWPNLVAWINRDVNMVVVPQTFGASMEPRDRDQVRANMEDAGIKPARVRLMLDAAKSRPAGWDGCLFHMERAVA